MKKLLLSLVALLATLGAWAEVTQPETGVYVISGDNPAGKRGKLAAVEGITAHPALSNITWNDNNGNYTGNSATPITNGEHWFVYKIGDKYVIYNLGLEKYLYNPKNGNQIDFSDSPYLWEILVNSSNKNFNSIYDATGTYLCFACGKKAENRNVHFNNQVGDGGSLHTFTDVENGETTYATKIAEIKAALEEREITYTLTDPNGVTYTGSYTGKPQLDYPEFKGVKTISNYVWNDASFTADITFPVEVNKNVFISLFNDTNHKVYRNVSNIKVKMNYEPVISQGTTAYDHYLWKIIPEFNNHKFTFKVQNVESNTYMFTESTVDAHASNTVTLGNTATKFEIVTASNGALALKLPTTKSNGDPLYLSASSSTNEDQVLGTHAVHNGTKLVVIPADVVPCTYRFTDIAQNVYEGTYDGIPRITHPEFAGVMGQTYANENWNNTHITATINFTFKVSSPAIANPILMTNNGKLWRAEKNNDGYYVHISTTNNDVPELGTWQWLIYPTFNNGEFTFKIMNVGTGLFVYVASTQGNDPQGSNKPVKLQAEGTTFKNQQANNRFAFIGSGGGSYYLTVNGSGSNNCPLGVWDGGHSYSDIGYPTMNKFTFKVSQIGWATLYAPFAGTISGENDVKTYAITADGIQDGYATLTEMTDVAANQGAIIEAAEGTYTFTAGNVSSDWNGNLLTGTSVNTMIEGEAYVLGNVDGIGLYKAKLTDGSFLNNAGKAYLPASAVPAGARFLSFDFGGNETAIESVESETATDAIVYDLAGRRVKAAQKGLYIVNGKVVIK